MQASTVSFSLESGDPNGMINFRRRNSCLFVCDQYLWGRLSDPFDRTITEVVKLKNLGDKPLAFRVKTTAPSQYCVKPNSGKVEPGESKDIQG